MKGSRWFAAALCVAAMVAVSQPAARTVSGFTVTPIDVPGSILTAATGIDTLGRIVGYFVDGSGTHGFLFERGTFTTISYPGAAWTAAYGVNSSGQIVGA